jgi:hypothetical protein
MGGVVETQTIMTYAGSGVGSVETPIKTASCTDASDMLEWHVAVCLPDRALQRIVFPKSKHCMYSLNPTMGLLRTHQDITKKAEPHSPSIYTRVCFKTPHCTLH